MKDNHKHDMRENNKKRNIILFSLCAFSLIIGLILSQAEHERKKESIRMSGVVKNIKKISPSVSQYVGDNRINGKLASVKLENAELIEVPLINQYGICIGDNVVVSISTDLLSNKKVYSIIDQNK